MSNTIDNLDALKREAIEPFAFSRAYWEATRRKTLLIQYCCRTGQYQFYPRPTSVFTGRRDLEWREVSGRGEIFSFTIAHRGRGPFRGHEPYLIVVVKLDIGVNVIGNLVHCGREDIHIGMQVIPSWAPLPGGEHLLMFEPHQEPQGQNEATLKIASEKGPAVKKRTSS